MHPSFKFEFHTNFGHDVTKDQAWERSVKEDNLMRRYDTIWSSTRSQILQDKMNFEIIIKASL